jgi:hypothetical protein
VQDTHPPRSREEWKARIESTHVNDAVSRDAEDAFTRLEERARSRQEGKCLVIAAPSGAGKTHLLNRFRRRTTSQVTRDDCGLVHPVLSVTAPSPCNFKTLGRTLYYTLVGDDLPQRATVDEVWRKLSYQLFGQPFLLTGLRKIW